ncbi:MAG TPA: chemotaxis-specific protein-glutamate methyltransferase CheB, partial [Kiloniellales bacterium]|nr:chemotaxis-specific protein-glutamate methyltransferase CheB [Kiloniellales bacterium]
NGRLAVDTIARRDVELVVLDIEMPVMDGLTALPLLLAARPGVQILVASTLTRKNAEISLRAMAVGAADYVTKPSSTSELHSAEVFKRELVEKVKALAEARRRGTGRALQGRPAAPRLVASDGAAKRAQEIRLRTAPIARPELIAIGSSTGGPQALTKLLGALGREISQPILVTQHMPATFTSLLAQHIGRAAGAPCAEAEEGERLERGRIYIAPGNFHLELERDEECARLHLTQGPPENFCRPSVDPMLRSLAAAYGPQLLAVILTGMGTDGRKGAEAVIAAGGTVIAQDEATSVVWGMPGAVAAAGLCSAILPLTEIAPFVRKLVMRSAA